MNGGEKPAIDKRVVCVGSKEGNGEAWSSGGGGGAGMGIRQESKRIVGVNEAKEKQDMARDCEFGVSKVQMGRGKRRDYMDDNKETDREQQPVSHQH